MALQFLDKIATFLIISFFVIGIYDVTTTMQQDVPVFQNAVEATQTGDYLFVFQVARMGWGWSQITPTIHVDILPFPLSIYRYYSRLILPSGYLPLPGWEDFVFVGIVLLSMLPIAIYLKKKRQNQPGGLWGLPLWFFLSIPLILILLYPVWCWFNLWFMYVPGAQAVFGMDAMTAYQTWITFSDNTASFSWFFVFMTAIGLYKGGKWSKKFVKW